MLIQQRRNLVAAALVGLLVLLAWQHRWTFEDGFINFRIVKQLEAGHGPVFNSGQRVEAFTSPLWLFILASADALTPVRIEWLSVFLGIAFTATGLASSICASRRLWSGIDDRSTEVPVGALAITATAPIWYFATSGLEGGLTFAWLGCALLVLSNWAARSRPPSRRGWLLLGAGWLVRPELVLFSLAGILAIVFAERSERSLVRRIAATGWAWLVPLAYEIFRMGYYGSLLPNTAYAKDATGVRWDRGWAYFGQFVGNYWLWAAAACLIVGGYVPLLARLARDDGRRFAAVIAWLAGTFLTTLYIVRLGGDYIDARLLLPSFFAFCGPVAVTRVATTLRATSSVALMGWALIAATSLRPPTPYTTFVLDSRRNVVTVSDAIGTGVALYSFAIVSRDDFTFDLRHITGERNADLPKRTTAIFGVGVLGYALGTGVYVFDLGGLADPIAARFELAKRGYPGHEKLDPPAWSAARLLAPGADVAPGLFFLGFRPLIPPTTGAAFARQIDEARHALQCGDLRKLQDSYQGRLDVGRFATNIFHSFTYSRITIPPNPAAAEKKFCKIR